MKLTAKQQKFVEEYCIDLNAAAAARRAGYRETHSRQMGAENLSKPYIQAAIQKHIEKIRQETGAATPEEIIAGYTRDIRFDPRKLFNRDGSLKDPVDLDDQTALSLTGIEITFRPDGNKFYRYKLPDKCRSRDSLSKYFHLFTEKQEYPLSPEIINMILSVLPENARQELLRRLDEELKYKN